MIKQCNIQSTSNLLPGNLSCTAQFSIHVIIHWLWVQDGVALNHKINCILLSIHLSFGDYVSNSSSNPCLSLMVSGNLRYTPMSRPNPKVGYNREKNNVFSICKFHDGLPKHHNIFSMSDDRNGFPDGFFFTARWWSKNKNPIQIS